MEVNMSLCVQRNVLKKRVSLDCIVDVRLRLFVKVDNLRVASTLKVEYSVVILAVLVVSDEKSLRICGQRCLACSGKSEEDSCVLAVHICIG